MGTADKYRERLRKNSSGPMVLIIVGSLFLVAFLAVLIVMATSIQKAKFSQEAKNRAESERFAAEREERNVAKQKQTEAVENFNVMRHKPDVSCTADQLYATFQENELRANELLNGAIVEISGTVESVSRDIRGKPYVTLETNSALFTVQCFADDSSELMKLNKDEIVSIRGVCSGSFLNVFLKRCKVVR
jgi:hypothetical protein